MSLTDTLPELLIHLLCSSCHPMFVFALEWTALILIVLSLINKSKDVIRTEVVTALTVWTFVFTSHILLTTGQTIYSAYQYRSQLAMAPSLTDPRSWFQKLYQTWTPSSQEHYVNSQDFFRDVMADSLKEIPEVVHHSFMFSIEWAFFVGFVTMLYHLVKEIFYNMEVAVCICFTIFMWRAAWSSGMYLYAMYFPGEHEKLLESINAMRMKPGILTKYLLNQ